jgi:prepilin-type N-terminal cleavage/methylation domain-containing protein/prepilin-type processing-associated H-X9-DG protein
MRSRRAFTLVELLVVIGIIALLVGILMPALSRAKESANRIACLANLRTLGQGFVMYTNDNRGRYPRPAAGGAKYEDWVYWENTAARPFEQSRIAPFLGKSFNRKALTCPSDDASVHPHGYPFSYTVNGNICVWQTGSPTLTTSQVRKSSEKILLIDESSQTVDDGCWQPQHWVLDQKNILANRHDKTAEASTDKSAGRGNVLFADNHAEFIPRAWTLDPAYWDPRK